MPDTPSSPGKPALDDETLARLRAEARAPYRGLRQFFYLAFAASALLGSVVFFFKLLAGREIVTTLTSFGLQVGILSLMIWLYRLEQRRQP